MFISILLPIMFFLLVVVGGILFKVYIVGETVKVVRRFSLPDVSKRELSKNPGVFRFPRVSCAAASADEADLDPCVGGEPTFLLVTLFLETSNISYLIWVHRIYGMH